jgi:hypothetical protein
MVAEQVNVWITPATILKVLRYSAGCCDQANLQGD